MAGWLTWWHVDPSVLAGLILLAGAYTLGLRSGRRGRSGTRPATRGQIASFGLGLWLVVLALGSPLHELSDHYLFSAHMAQHLVLMLLVPPLLLLGCPDWLLRPLVQLAVVFRVARVLTAPPVAFLAVNVIFWTAHWPPLYDLMLRQHDLHALEHLVFLAAATLMWWPVFSPLVELPALSYPAQMLYLFVQTMPASLLGALITLAGGLVYRGYAAAPRVWGVSPMADQQLGGLIMWVGGGLFFLGAVTVVFFRWAKQEESQEVSGWTA